MNIEEAYQRKNVLITGGLGFIGSNLARRLVALGANVTIIDSLIWSYGGNMFNVEDIQDKLIINIGDIRDRYSINHLIQGKDYLFNLAGQVSHIDSMKDPLTDLEINVTSQVSILEACRQFNPGIKIIYASSRQIYGKPQYLPADEKHPIQPTDVNGININAGEWYHILYNNVYGIRAASLRMTNVYGPRQLVKHNRQGFIGWFIRQAVEGNIIQLYGDGSQKRDLNFVDDVCDALLLVGSDEQANGQIYNLGSADIVSLKELAELLVELSGRGSCELVPWPEEKKKIDIGDYYGSFDKIKNDLGWQPKTPLREGLGKTIAYYKEHLDKYVD
ncbi:MAG: NAD-dependent epimerase/dehydratase family protein [Parcubacteria group bacterium]|nr:NAD-dependent epimerase/dehydratase family protein [Parcubacteria group bacterium]